MSVPAESPRTGTFRIAKEENKKLDVLFKRPEGGEDRAEIALSDDGKLSIRMGGGVELLMKRAN
ncbi:MAG: hypothetical protein HOV80_30780 [Polyangiaceae bacterium]|nr:hypothetical protein [Polyangiaceae bacterium]